LGREVDAQTTLKGFLGADPPTMDGFLAAPLVDGQDPSRGGWTCHDANRKDNQACTVLIIPGFPGADDVDEVHYDQILGDLEDQLSTPYSDVRIVATYGAECAYDDDASNHGKTLPIDDGNPHRHGYNQPDFSDDHVVTSFGGSCDAAIKAVHTKDASWRHLAYHVAWYIFHEFTDQNPPIPVDVVAHSAGGLIMRYALGQVAEHHPDFPPILLVEDVVTMATPHDGATGGFNFAGTTWYACDAKKWYTSWWAYRELQELCWYDSFIREIATFDYPMMMDAGLKTDWTVMGSRHDEWVASCSATYMQAPHVLAWGVSNECSPEKRRECGNYSHVGILHNAAGLETVCHYWSIGENSVENYYADGYIPIKMATLSALYSIA
jgi:pimeloyl-ACP methyl ester carboxylesterase